jgi:hypothetical protein
MMDVFDLFQDLLRLALDPLCHSASRDLRNLVGSQTPQTYFTTALEELVGRKMAFEDDSIWLTA